MESSFANQHKSLIDYIEIYLSNYKEIKDHQTSFDTKENYISTYDLDE